MSVPVSAAQPQSTPAASPSPLPAIPFIDLQAQRRRLGDRIDQAVGRVLTHGGFLQGPEVFELERQLAAYCGVAHSVSCSSGTDALLMLLMALSVGPGDAVICPSFTFTATAEVVHLLGATAVFADVGEQDFNLDPACLPGALKAARDAGLRPVGIIAVDLFGQPARYPELDRFAQAEGLWLLADAAQSFGAQLGNRRVGALARFSATSFYPAKPLGAYGDGGAILTDDPELRDKLVSIRVHGQGTTDKYENVRLGLTARLDTIQAAILLQKLTIFDDELVARNAVAARYQSGLEPSEFGDRITLPTVMADATTNWAVYTVQVDDRDGLQGRLKAKGVPTMIYYPRPLHRQPPYQACPVGGGALPVTDRLAARVLSLPIHPYLDAPTQDRIIDALRTSL